MAWRVDEVDEEARAILALLNEVQVVLRELVEEGDGPGGKGTPAQMWTASLGAGRHQAGGAE